MYGISTNYVERVYYVVIRGGSPDQAASLGPDRGVYSGADSPTTWQGPDDQSSFISPPHPSNVGMRIEDRDQRYGICSKVHRSDQSSILSFKHSLSSHCYSINLFLITISYYHSRTKWLTPQHQLRPLCRFGAKLKCLRKSGSFAISNKKSLVCR